MEGKPSVREEDDARGFGLPRRREPFLWVWCSPFGRGEYDEEDDNDDGEEMEADDRRTRRDARG